MKFSSENRDSLRRSAFQADAASHPGTHKSRAGDPGSPPLWLLTRLRTSAQNGMLRTG